MKENLTQLGTYGEALPTYNNEFEDLYGLGNGFYNILGENEPIKDIWSDCDDSDSRCETASVLETNKIKNLEL